MTEFEEVFVVSEIDPFGNVPGGIKLLLFFFNILINIIMLHDREYPRLRFINHLFSVGDVD